MNIVIFQRALPYLSILSDLHCPLPENENPDFCIIERAATHMHKT